MKYNVHVEKVATQMKNKTTDESQKSCSLPVLKDLYQAASSPVGSCQDGLVFHFDPTGRRVGPVPPCHLKPG